MSEGAVQVYISTVSSNLGIKKNQQKIEMILSSKRIEVEYVDISSNEAAKKKMREIVGDEKALPPQICRGNKYLGDYEEFENAVELENLNGFLEN